MAYDEIRGGTHIQYGKDASQIGICQSTPIIVGTLLHLDLQNFTYTKLKFVISLVAMKRTLNPSYGFFFLRTCL